MKSLADEAIDTVFAPRVVTRKLVLAIALETGLVCSS